MNEMKELSGERRLVFFHGSEVAMRGCKKRRAQFVHFQCCCVCFCVSTRVAIVHKCYFLLMWLFVRLLF